MKQTKVALITLITLFYTFVMVIIFSQETLAAQYITDENFDGMVCGSEPIGWIVSPTNRSDASIKVEKAPSGQETTSVRGNAIRIEDNSTEFPYPSYAYKTFKSSDKIVVTFDYYLESVKGANGFTLGNGGISTDRSKIKLAVFDNGDGTATFKYFDNSKWKYINTSKTDIKKNTWYSFKIVLDNTDNTAEVYIDNQKICDAYQNPNINKPDRLIFSTNNKASTDDIFWIDNVRITDGSVVIADEHPNVFTDTFENGYELSNYNMSGSVIIKDNHLVLPANEYAERIVGTVMSGKFSFTATLENVTDLKFALMDGDKYGFYITAKSNGTLCYLRDNKQIEFTDDGIIKANEEIHVAVNLPLDRNANYAKMYINGNYVGTVIYTNDFNNITALRFESSGNVVLDNVSAGKSEMANKMPDRETAHSLIYVPEVIESTPLYLAYDLSASDSSMSIIENTVTIDENLNSVGVDLGFKQRINAIRLYDSDAAVDARGNHFTLWHSDDNVTWTEIKGFHFNRILEDGKAQVLFEFSGINARYVKIHSTNTENKGSINIIVPSLHIRAERRIARQWKMSGMAMQAINDTSPTTTPLKYVVKEEPLTLTKGDSIGIWFGINCEVEAIELSVIDPTKISKNTLALYYSNDNITYTEIKNLTISMDEASIRLTFDSIKCGYLKLYVSGEVNIQLSSIQECLSAYSSEEVKINQATESENRGAEGHFYTLPDGTLIAAYNGFGANMGPSSDFADTSINYFKSIDGGYTWESGGILLDKSPNSVNILHPSFIYLENGEIAIIYCEKNTYSVANIYIRRSKDYGATWSKAQLITGAPQGYTILTSGNRVLRLSTGRILIPVGYAPVVDDVYGSDRAIAYVWYSDDDGYTWERSLDAITLPHSALEPCVAELENGDILLSLRTRNERKIYQSISSDGGLTWAQPTTTSLQSPSATNSLISLMATGDVAIVWNNDTSSSDYDRRLLSIAITSDNGLTYNNIRTLVDFDYPSSWPGIVVYGRSVFLMYGNETNVRVFDIATLYYTTSGKVTISDLTCAPTPNAAFDKSSGWLTGVSKTMQYSLDGGNTWYFAGGTTVLLDMDKITSSELLVKDIGDQSYSPSEIQIITIYDNSDTPPSDGGDTPPTGGDDTPPTGGDDTSQKKENVNLPTILAVISYSLLIVGIMILAVHLFLRRKNNKNPKSNNK